MEQEYRDEFTISRKKWLRGKGGINSFLFNQFNGKMCCIGFYAMHCGLTVKDILNVTTPGKLRKIGKNIPLKMSWLLSNKEGNLLGNSPACIDIMGANDDEVLPEWERETKIKEAFAAIANTKVNFVD